MSAQLEGLDRLMKAIRDADEVIEAHDADDDVALKAAYRKLVVDPQTARAAQTLDDLFRAEFHDSLKTPNKFLNDDGY